MSVALLAQDGIQYYSVVVQRQKTDGIASLADRIQFGVHPRPTPTIVRFGESPGLALQVAVPTLVN